MGRAKYIVQVNMLVCRVKLVKPKSWPSKSASEGVKMPHVAAVVGTTHTVGTTTIAEGTGIKMNTKLNELNTALKSAVEYVDEVSKHARERVADVERMIQETWNEMFNADKKLQAALTELESTKQLTGIDHDEFLHQWVRYTPKEGYSVEALQRYLEENCINFDPKNDCLTTSIGPCLIIDSEGDVYDQDSAKTIIRASQYETVEQRDALISAWMQKNGYFPSVVKADRYGNDFRYVNVEVEHVQ